MNLVFADAAFWIARRDKKDENHPKAIAIAKRLLEERAYFVITPLVFAEAHARFSRGRFLGERLIADCWNNPIVRFEQPTFEDQELAIRILRTYRDKTFSFCDAVSFVVMERLEIRKVVTFDDHFWQYGRFDVIDGSDL